MPGDIGAAIPMAKNEPPLRGVDQKGKSCRTVILRIGNILVSLLTGHLPLLPHFKVEV